jgi:hypothetical protein
LDQTLQVGPDIDVESWRLSVPARPACFLLLDAAQAPIQLATTANLRAALAKRLSPRQTNEPDESSHPTTTSTASRRIDYHQLIRSVRYRFVHSRFEADWVYLNNAHTHLPRAFDDLTKRFSAHWLHINTADAYPRFVSVDRPIAPEATCFGPLPGAKATQKFVHALESLFDLCREHRLLLQTPNARACDYKAMGRCPAPCDGTIPFNDYRAQLRAAIDFISQPQDAWRHDQTERMRLAASDQDFETAQRIKQQLDTAASLESAPPPLTDFRGLIVTPGPSKTTYRTFGYQPGAIEPLGDLPANASTEQLNGLTDRLGAFPQAEHAADDRLRQKHTALVAWHMLHGHTEHRTILRGETAFDHDVIGAAVTDLLTPKEKTTNGGGEGGGAGVVDLDSDVQD